MSRIVVKLGGAVARDAVSYPLALAEQGHEVCVVHGAGPQISLEMARRGIEVAFVHGRRVTTPEALEVVREALAQVNAELVAAIGATRGRPDRRRDRARGRAGSRARAGRQSARRALRARLIEALGAGRIPVVAPLARGPLNVNADEAAAMLAVGIGAERVHFVTDVPGPADRRRGRRLDPRRRGRAAARRRRPRRAGSSPSSTAAVHAARQGVVAEIGETAVVA